MMHMFCNEGHVGGHRNQKFNTQKIHDEADSRVLYGRFFCLNVYICSQDDTVFLPPKPKSPANPEKVIGTFPLQKILK
jgi:hypothetical protein